MLVREKSWPQIAAMMNELVENNSFREHILAGQQARLERYRQLDLESQLKQVMKPILETSP